MSETAARFETAATFKRPVWGNLRATRSGVYAGLMPLLDVLIRRAAERDLPSLGRLGAQLIREHHAFDRERFMAPGPDPEAGYAWFLGTQLANEDVAVLVAERGDQVAGYIYAAIEPRSWQDLRDEAGVVHDVAVDERFRRAGIATALLEAAAA
jgi:ribosomal protein S18 acetylase RimI-like enzyme